MCAYGLVDPVTGWAMKKPISLLHNIPMNVFHRLVRRCDNKHEHQRITGSSPGYGSRAVISQVYPWQFCNQLAGVIKTLLKRTNPPTQFCLPAREDETIGETWGDWWEAMADDNKRTEPRMVRVPPSQLCRVSKITMTPNIRIDRQ